MPLHTAADVRAARELLGDAGAVVVLAVYNAHDDALRCYQSFFAHTPVEVPLLVVDDAGPDRRPVEVLDEVKDAIGDRLVVVLAQQANKGFVLGMNDAFAATGRADVVLLNSDVVVGPEWFERLRAAATASSATATASALTNHGSILSLPYRNTSSAAMPGDLSVDEAARRVARAAARTRPRIPTAVAHCTYVRRAAFDLVGVFDPAFSPGYGEEVDFCQRLVSAGMQHVAADDVFVYHRGGSTFGRSPEVLALQRDHDRMIERRYPYYAPWVREISEDRSGPLSAALLTARVALLGLRLAVDGMCLGPNLMGTQLVVLETVKALAERPGVQAVTVFVSNSCPPGTRRLLTAHPKVALRELHRWTVPTEPEFDLVYRPYQVNFAFELDWLRGIAARTVVNQLDLIAYHNGSYFSSAAAWKQYRELARTVGAGVDGVAFLSRHVADEVAAEGLLPAGTPGRVVLCGTEHVRPQDVTIDAPAPWFADRVQAPFLLFLGASYGHKNRHFALHLLDALREGGWTGQLVLAGPTPPSGSTASAEAEVLLRRPQLAASVVDVGAVSEEDKAWLYAHCALVLYPTVAEGFGLVPFEAAAYGKPTLSTRQGSLDEVLPEFVVTLRDWDLADAARLADTLLADRAAADAFVTAVREQGRGYTWARVAAELEQLFSEVLARPAAPPPAAASRAGSRRRPPQAVNRGFVGAVTAVSRRPALKQWLSPSGSRREKYSRAVIRAVGSRL